jgi:ribosomal protein S18 acetylase RimI-like enzyme
LTVIDLKTQPGADWKQTIINHYAFLPYWWISGITAGSRQALMGRDLDSALSGDRTCLLGYVAGTGDLLGFAQMRWLEWDTHHFGFEIWRLDHLGVGNLSQQRTIANALAQGCLRAMRGLECQNIQARIPIDNLSAIHALENAGFQTMEILTTWLFDFTRSSIPPTRNPELVRDFEPADAQSLIELARTVYTPIPDRFHVDPHLSSKASNELYAEWIRNSCTGQLADHISVAESDGKTVGYATLKYLGDHDGLCNARIAQLGLGAMSPGFRDQGFVTDLVIHNLEWLNRRQAAFCFVGTQGNNIPPQRVWLKAGLKPATMSLTLHYWEGNDDGDTDNRRFDGHTGA